MPFSGPELLIIIVIAMVVIGPENMPKAAASLGRAVRQFKSLTLDAKARLKDELGPELEDLDLRSLDPRQYDPRRIVREALQEDIPPRPAAMPLPPAVQDPAAPQARTSAVPGMPPQASPYTYVPGEPAPFDDEAT
ncbi:MAG: twin-arginine translocase TatA/TatE family subunit [Bowdeniella nasicola]|nr:twin-arginine translocase TatA/TatE family subunit [Bowdeniella nasicola]